jgi:hypothetical protein
MPIERYHKTRRLYPVFAAIIAVLSACSSTPRTTNGEITTRSHISASLIREDPTKQYSSVSQDRFGDLYVLSRRTNSLIKYSGAGDSLRTVSGLGAGHYQFNDPVDIDARFPNRIFVADRLNHRIEEYSRDLAHISTLQTRNDPDTRKRFGYPEAIASDNAGNLFVVDGEGRRVLKFRSDRSFETSFGGYSESSDPAGALSSPVDITTDNVGNVAVLDATGPSLVAFDNFGSVRGRVLLPAHARHITSSGDSVLVLMSDATVRIYKLRDMSVIALWDTQPSGDSSVDLAAGGRYYLLSPAHIDRITASPASFPGQQDSLSRQ